MRFIFISILINLSFGWQIFTAEYSWLASDSSAVDNNHMSHIFIVIWNYALKEFYFFEWLGVNTREFLHVHDMKNHWMEFFAPRNGKVSEVIFKLSSWPI